MGGADKALAPLHGAPLIQYPLAVLAEAAGEVLLACGPSARYADLGRELVLDGMPDGGPLAGLAAGLDAARARGAQWVLVLACDMPRARARVLEALLQRARERGADACLLQLERGSQPTYAAYHVRCAPAARRALEAGERRLVAFHELPCEGRAPRIELLDARELDPGGGIARSAGNLNTPSELEAERGACAVLDASAGRGPG
jgi:molybdopterin-guanine dinucleotide biosynthesis protein A